jgi:hypothetical protein
MPQLGIVIDQSLALAGNIMVQNQTWSFGQAPTDHKASR